MTSDRLTKRQQHRVHRRFAGKEVAQLSAPGFQTLQSAFAAFVTEIIGRAAKRVDTHEVKRYIFWEQQRRNHVKIFVVSPSEKPAVCVCRFWLGKLVHRPKTWMRT
jgi:hypothetical protein